ncbi:hypothetical protein JCM15519_19800 [Fundidesulfovibrio butyratiphilus]
MTSDITGVSGQSGLNTISSKQVFGAEVVKGTLDTLNSGGHSGNGLNADYDFQTKVLEAGFAKKGAIFDGNV